MIEQLVFEFFEPNPDLIILGPDPERPGRWLVRCPDCDEIRSLGRAGRDRAITHRHTRCHPCASIIAGKARRWQTIQSTDDLIFLGEDPEQPGQWLIKCPDCGEIRSLSRLSLSNIVFRQRSNCRSCAERKLGLRKRTQLPTSENCIIVEQFYKRYEYKWKALVICPDCGKKYAKDRLGIKDQGHTICKTCVLRSHAKPLPRSENCIIIQEFAPGCSVKNPTALVECPSCHKQFEKCRGSIPRDEHTICGYCATLRGEDHPKWRGGSDGNRGRDWRRAKRQVRERDNDTCQWPGCTKTSETSRRALDIHHIVPYRQTQDNSGSNLVCLCQPHHGYAECHLDESIPLLQAIVKERLEPKYLEKTLVCQ